MSNWNGKLVVVKDDTSFDLRVGNIINVINGRLHYPNGTRGVVYDNYDDFYNCNMLMRNFIEEYREDDIMSYWNGKYRASRTDNCGSLYFTKNIVYNVVDGYVIGDGERKSNNRYSSLGEFEQSNVSIIGVLEELGIKYKLEDLFGKYIHCETKEEIDKLLQWFEKQGCLWESGDKPTDRIPLSKKYEHFTVRKEKRISVSDDYYILKVNTILEFKNIILEGDIMRKSDLKTGMRVKTRDGEIQIVIKNTLFRGEPIDIIVSKNGWNRLDRYNEDLTNINHKLLDIVEVYTIDGNEDNFTRSFLNTDKRKLYWKREEAKEMTLEEIEKELGYKIKLK